MKKKEAAILRDLFEDILSICTDSGYTRQTCQEESLRGMVSFFADHYDHIQIDTMWSMINQYVQKQGITDDVGLSESADYIMNVIK